MSKKTLKVIIFLTLIIGVSIVVFNNWYNDFKKPLEYHNNKGTSNMVTVKMQLAFTNEVQEFQAEVVDSLLIIEGDIIIGTIDEYQIQPMAAIVGKGKRWKNGIIPFKIQSNHPKKNDIMRAISEVNKKTNLTLKPRKREDDYIVFLDKDNCASYVGKQGDKQIIECGNCSYGSIIHEILHAAGLYHEHSRKDRDKYIIINENNIEEDFIDNFKRYVDKSKLGSDINDYDYNSIMHYSEDTFSKNNNKTISLKIPPANELTKIGQRDSLSKNDIVGINKVYPK